MGTSITFNAPLLPDYVSKESLGRGSSYVQITTTIATLVATSETVIDNYVGIEYIFWTVGSFTIFCVLCMIFGLKEIHKQNIKIKKTDQKDEKQDENFEKVGAKYLIKTACKDISSDPHYLIAIFSNVNCKVLGLVLQQFSLIYVTDTYIYMYEKDGSGSKEEAISDSEYIIGLIG